MQPEVVICLSGHGSFSDRPRAEAKYYEDWFRSGKTKNPFASWRLSGSTALIPYWKGNAVKNAWAS